MSSAEKPGGPATTLVLHPLDPLRFVYGIPMIAFGVIYLAIGDWSQFWLAVTAILCLVVGFVLTAMGATAVVDGEQGTRTVQVELNCRKPSGPYCHAYFDGLELRASYP